jgi:hypothetical protein
MPKQPNILGLFQKPAIGGQVSVLQSQLCLILKGSPISVSGQEGKWISGSQPFFH